MKNSAMVHSRSEFQIHISLQEFLSKLEYLLFDILVEVLFARKFSVPLVTQIHLLIIQLQFQFFANT